MSKPGATQQDYDVARAKCEAESWTKLPANQVQYMSYSGGFTDGKENCVPGGPNGTKICTREKVWNPPRYSTRDANEEGREALTRACLLNDGWRPVEN
ncbi:hypothetical protein ABLE91_10170 [Aquabacter sp. CN5-332]|uniref:hypothetical protein n=1 Tax=Aquabacter sp. CN5-332 TaxID=3156608 RepID=UPI0032B344E2